MLEWMGRGPKINGPITVSSENREALEEIVGAFRVEKAGVEIEEIAPSYVVSETKNGKVSYLLRGTRQALAGIRASVANIESLQERVNYAQMVTTGIIDKANTARIVTGGVISLVGEIRKGNVPSFFNKTWIE